MKPESCDTFVALGDVTDCGHVIFGKNSDRPKGEVQDVVFVKGGRHEAGKKLKCTYISIPQAAETYSTILSKPNWMWGAEMGANEHGVVIGNEAVFDRLNSDDDLVPRLLGMDLLRLGLERSRTAEEALTVVTSLLEEFGQGGQCSNITLDFSYHNSFLIADPKEAWILETADRHWVAQKITTGVRNISNCMSITTNYDRISSEIETLARNSGWLTKDEPFNWSKAMDCDEAECKISKNPETRFEWGRSLLTEKAENGSFSTKDMASVMRHVPSGICRPYEGFASCPTSGCQISVLNPNGFIHWFTATTDPHQSVFKPFVFSDNLEIASEDTVTNAGESSHRLRSLHLKVKRDGSTAQKMEEMEKEFMTEKFVLEEAKKSGSLFARAVQREMELYKSSTSKPMSATTVL